MIKVAHSVFESAGGCREDFFAATAEKSDNFAAEAAALWDAYLAALPQCSCSDDGEVLLRFHLSDVTNQLPELERLVGHRKSLLSIVGQAPANARIALEAWHWHGASLTRSGGGVVAGLQNYRAHWFNVPQLPAASSYEQTAAEFEQLKKFLAASGGNVASHTVRTWLYCRDVDNNYQGLVDARNDFFAANGLTRDTHFIASTGIEGQMADVHRLVKMDSLSIPELRPEQMIYLSAPEMLSPTTLYGVSFERGTRVVYGDRSHYFISGTASIDSAGKVVHPHDVIAQSCRMLDNVDALLKSSGSELSQIRWATLYLRDIADADAVTAIVKSRIGSDLPLVTVKAPVCRPGWLVELECVAVNDRGDSAYPDFC